MSALLKKKIKINNKIFFQKKIVLKCREFGQVQPLESCVALNVNTIKRVK